MDYDALERLVRLRDQGALSGEEFTEQKRVLFESDGADAFAPLNAAQSFHASSPLRKIGAVAFIIGLCTVLYSTFIYDTTISPMDAASPYSLVDETSSIEDRASAISDVTNRFNRTMAGERVVNLSRVEEQHRVLSFGALLMILGAAGIVISLAQKRR